MQEKSSHTKIIGSIDPNTEIWRYISIEKLVDLLEHRRLYFSAISSYANSDPFEGYLPFVAMKAHAKIYRKQYDELKEYFKKIEIQKSDSKLLPEAEKLYEEAKAAFEEYEKSPSKIFNSITRDIRVNCWHVNQNESDAMWKIYAQDSQGVALASTVQRIRESIINDNENVPVQIGRVKYIDFFDKRLEPKDCLADGGYLSPLLKRIEFVHEKELRLFMVPRKDLNENELPEYVSVDVMSLLQRIVISPYSSSLFSRAVRSILHKYGIEENIIEESSLLARFKEYEDNFRCQ